jgi:multidrug efflux pump subunit AcrA (membrane-fusion protein)
MVFKSIRSIGVLVAACLIAAFFVAIRSEPARQHREPAVPVVQVVAARPEARTMTVEAFGTVKPRETLKLTAEVAGRVVYVHPEFKEGRRVAHGNVILRIDQRRFRLDVAGARVRITQARADLDRLAREVENLKANIALAGANAALSQKELLRIRKLNKDAFASLTALDRAEQQNIQARMTLQGYENALALTDAAIRNGEAALSMARIDLDRAQLALEHTEIRATFSGVVLERKVETGEFITVGQTFGSLFREGELDVEVRIPLEKMQWIEPLFEQNSVPRAVVATTGVDSGHRWQASLVRVKGFIDEQTRTLPMVLEVDRSVDMGLRPGTFVHCTISGTRHDPIYVVSRHLLHPDNTLYILNGDRLEIRQVTVLRRFREEVFVSEGLNPRDKIIVSPVGNPVRGMKLVEKPVSGEGLPS